MYPKEEDEHKKAFQQSQTQLRKRQSHGLGSPDGALTSKEKKKREKKQSTDLRTREPNNQNSKGNKHKANGVRNRRA